VGNAITLPEERYLEIEPEPFNNDYSIRLPSNLVDFDGGQIRNNLEYVVAVLVVGTGTIKQIRRFKQSKMLTYLAHHLNLGKVSILFDFNSIII